MKLAVRAGLALLLSSWVSFAQEGGATPASDAAGDADSSSESQANLKTEKHDAEKAAPKNDDKKTEEASDDDKASPEDDSFGHFFQFGLRAGFMFGTRQYFRYDNSPLCQAYDTTKGPTDQRKTCGFHSSPGMEAALSFAVLDSVEPYLFGRFGFSGEAPTNTKALMMYGVGVRIYTMSDSRFKIFVEPALAYETEGGAGNPAWAHNGTGIPATASFTPDYKKDLIFHIGVGPQYDFAKAVGVFVTGNVDVGVLRAISATLALNIGLQVRFL